MVNIVKLLLDDRLVTCLANLYCIEKHINHYTFEPVSIKQIDELVKLNLIDSLSRSIIDEQVAYAAFEHYRQILCPDTLDKAISEDIEENKIIVDLCCGPGATMRSLLKKSPGLIYAFDHNHFYIELVNKIADYMGINIVQASVADAHSIPLKDQSVDVVVNRVTLQYLKVDKVLDEVSRVLKNGGSAIFIVHGSGYVIYSLLKRSRRVTLNLFMRGLVFNITRRQSHPYEIFLSPGVLMNILKQKGFNNFSILFSDQTLNYGPFPLYFAIKCKKAE